MKTYLYYIEGYNIAVQPEDDGEYIYLLVSDDSGGCGMRVPKQFFNDFKLKQLTDRRYKNGRHTK